MQDHHFLQSIFSPADFNERELAKVLSKFKPVAYNKKDFLLREGKTAHHYWFLESGHARSFVHDTRGNDITTNFYSPGEIIIDWSSFFLHKPTKENIQALSDCSCWQMDYVSFQALFHGNETFREHGRKRLVNAYFALKNHSTAMITDQAKERYLQLLEEKPGIIQNVSLQHIATYLGITKYSLSRIRKEISAPQ